MNLDIQFGELEEAQPEVRLRPDRNRHFAVDAVASPDDDDLPIYVDLDAMRDMEQHALSDTGVELGGVLLGGQYEDRNGRAFVLITDILRAQHYESTKGSFKFTHETWEKITRERDAFPEELQMVGWYHTHPDWGVFLSGPDMFICDHFFNRRLDVALVIDPCGQDRGFFQWTGDDAQRVRRTKGFYLVASRFRQYELTDFASYLEGKSIMTGDPRVHGLPHYPSPVVHITDRQNVWQGVAVLGCLVIQFCFLVLIAWRVLVVPTTPAAGGRPENSLAMLKESIDAASETRYREAEIDAKIEILDQVVGQYDGGKQGLIRSLTERTGEVDELRSSLRAHKSLEDELDKSISVLQSDVEKARQSNEYLDANVKRLQVALSDLKKRHVSQRDQIADLTNRLAAYEDVPDEAGEKSQEIDIWKWTWIGLGGALAALALGGTIAAVLQKRKLAEFEESPEDPPEEANNL